MMGGCECGRGFWTSLALLASRDCKCIVLDNTHKYILIFVANRILHSTRLRFCHLEIFRDHDVVAQEGIDAYIR